MKRFPLQWLRASLLFSLITAMPLSQADDTPLKAVATFSILGDMVQAVGGERVEVTLLVGPNGDAHVYRPTPAAARTILKADLLFVNGFEFEGWLDRLMDASGYKGTIVTATDGITGLSRVRTAKHEPQDDDHADEHGHEKHGDDHADAHEHDKHADEHGHEKHDDDHADEHGHEKHNDDHTDEHGHEKHDDGHADEHGHEKHNDDHADEHGHEKHDDEHADEHGHEERDEEHDDDHDDGHEKHGDEHADEHGHHHGNTDPHAWQSLTHAKTYIQNITRALQQADPAGSAVYTRNRDAYLTELAALEQLAAETLDTLPAERRTVVTSHDAFAYFADNHQLRFLAPQANSNKSEASARDVATLIEQIRSENINALFLENMVSPRLLEQIAQESDVSIGGKLYADALSAPDGEAGSYLKMMRHNIQMIYQTLKAK